MDERRKHNNPFYRDQVRSRGERAAADGCLVCAPSSVERRKDADTPQGIRVHDDNAKPAKAIEGGPAPAQTTGAARKLCLDCDHGVRGGQPCASCGGSGYEERRSTIPNRFGFAPNPDRRRAAKCKLCAVEAAVPYGHGLGTSCLRKAVAAYLYEQPLASVTPQVTPATEEEAMSLAKRMFDYSMTAVQAHLTIFPNPENHPHEIAEMAKAILRFLAATAG